MAFGVQDVRVGRAFSVIKHQRVAGIEPQNLIKNRESANNRSHHLYPHRDVDQQLFYEKKLRFRGNVHEFTFLRKFADILKVISMGRKSSVFPAFLLCVTRQATRELMFVYLHKTKERHKRPFPHSCKQRHQVETRVKKKQ